MSQMTDEEMLEAAIRLSIESFEVETETRKTFTQPVKNVDKPIKKSDFIDDYEKDVINVEEEIIEDEMRDDFEFDEGMHEDNMEEEDEFGNEMNFDQQQYEMDFGENEIILPEEKPYIVLSKTDITNLQKERIKKTKDFLSVSPGVARILLQFMKWDEEKLFEKFAENREKICKLAGVDPDIEQSVTGTQGQGECQICMEESNKITTLTCGHGFCRGCWKQYLDLQIKENKQNIKCPGKGCGRVMDEQIILKLAGSKQAKEKFYDNLARSFIEKNPMAKWCPAPNCIYAVLLNEFHPEKNESIRCGCGHYFCFRCSEIAHQPASCTHSKDWKVRNEGGNEALNEKFISTMSRPCPNCKTSIDKNGGCNHMQCSQCQFHFCWNCMGKFGSGPLGDTTGYSNHKCNSFYKDDEKLSLDKQDWERFQFYSERHNNHERSLKIESKILENIQTIRFSLQDETGLSWNGSQIYDDSIRQLLENRIIIMNSYVFGYYRPLQKNPVNKNLFEHRQNELETHTELLSKLLEEDDIEKLFARKEQLINISKLALKSNRALLDVAVNTEEVRDMTQEEIDMQKILESSMTYQAEQDLQKALNNSTNEPKRPKKRYNNRKD